MGGGGGKQKGKRKFQEGKKVKNKKEVHKQLIFCHLHADIVKCDLISTHFSLFRRPNRGGVKKYRGNAPMPPMALPLFVYELSQADTAVDIFVNTLSHEFKYRPKT